MVATQPTAGVANRFRRLLPSLAWVGAAVAVAWLLNVLWWGLLSPEAREEGGSTTVTIPAGTAAAIADGSTVPRLAAQLTVPEGGSLVVENLDSVEHTVGTFRIPPGETVEITTPLLSFVTPDGSSPDETVLNCSFHPSGYIGFALTHRPPFSSTLVLALLLGLPLGGLVAIAVAIVGKLDSGDDGGNSAALVA